MGHERERHRLLIRGCDVLDVPAAGECQVMRGRDISVRDGVIESVAPSRGGPAPDATDVIEAHGLLAVPGLVNAHTHSPMVLMRGAAEDLPLAAWFNERIWPIERNLTAADVRAGALLACAEMIRAGVTAFADHYFFAEEIATAVVESGLRANIAATHFSTQGREALDAGVQFAEDWHGRADGRVRAAMGPHAPYTVSDADLSLLADHARRLGVRVHIHASEDAEQTDASLRRRGVTPIGVLDATGVLDAGALIAHGCGIVDLDFALLAPHAATTAVVCCPKVYLKYAMSPLPPVRKLHRRRRKPQHTRRLGGGAAGRDDAEARRARRNLDDRLRRVADGNARRRPRPRLGRRDRRAGARTSRRRRTRRPHRPALRARSRPTRRARVQRARQ
jgi:5-methylthioadenosine/S-adenosylhomocysteine deaminase